MTAKHAIAKLFESPYLVGDEGDRQTLVANANNPHFMYGVGDSPATVVVSAGGSGLEAVAETVKVPPTCLDSWQRWRAAHPRSCTQHELQCLIRRFPELAAAIEVAEARLKAKLQTLAQRAVVGVAIQDVDTATSLDTYQIFDLAHACGLTYCRTHFSPKLWTVAGTAPGTTQKDYTVRTDITSSSEHHVVFSAIGTPAQHAKFLRQLSVPVADQ